MSMITLSTNRRRTNEYCTGEHDHTKHSMTTVNTLKNTNLDRDDHDLLNSNRSRTDEYCTREHDHTTHSMTTTNTLKSIALTVMIMITLKNDRQHSIESMATLTRMLQILTMLKTTSKRDGINDYDQTEGHDEELLRSSALNRLAVLKSTSHVHR